VRRRRLADREAAVARARSLGHSETLARALRSLAAIQFEEEAGDTALATLREAIQAASAAHDDRAVAELWGRLLVALVRLKRGDEAKTLVPAAGAAVARAATAIELQVAFLEVEGQVAAATGDVARAHELYAEAQRRVEAAGGAKPGSTLAARLLEVRTNGALIHGFGNDWPRLVKELRPLVGITDAHFGLDHPASLRIHFNLAVGLRHVRDDEGALIEFRAAARIAEARLAPSPSLVSVIQAVGSTLHQMGRYAESLPYLERALAMARKTMPPGDPALAGAIGDVAATHIELGRFDEARALLDEQLAIFDRLGRDGGLNHAHAVYNHANLDAKTNRWAQALPTAERAHAMYLKSGAPDHYDADGALLLVADCQLALRRWAAALASAARVLAQADSDPELRAAARFVRGQALAGQGNARAGLAEVRTARDEMVKLGLAKRIAEVDAWLAKR
jgi:tetratricopeptide (TPR) repeat protein